MADIRDEILNKGMQPGSPLPSERELCARYGVSRTVIREAVKVLSAQRLVRSIPGSGLTVGSIGIEDVAESLRMFMRHGTSLKYGDLHEVRMSLEVAAAGAAAERATKRDADRMLRLVDELAVIGDDLVLASRNDFDFHIAIVQATGNEFMGVLFHAMEGALMETRVATFSMDPKRVALVAESHRLIAEGIRQGEPDVAMGAMRAHLEEVKATWDAHPEKVFMDGPMRRAIEDDSKA